MSLPFPTETTVTSTEVATTSELSHPRELDQNERTRSSSHSILPTSESNSIPSKKSSQTIFLPKSSARQLTPRNQTLGVKRHLEIEEKKDDIVEETRLGKIQKQKDHPQKVSDSHSMPAFFPSPKCVTENSSSTAVEYSEATLVGLDHCAIRSDSRNVKNEEPKEAGLSLLFAASLIQQKDGEAADKAQIFESQSESNQNSNRNDAFNRSSFESTLHGTAELQSNQSTSSSQQNVAHALDLAENAPDVGAYTGDANLQSTSPQEFTSSFNNDSIITNPNDTDVLCGRGGGINKHTGNIIYRRVVEHNKTLYKQVPKRHRMLVSQSIVQAILNSGGRFLQQQESTATNETWKEIHFRRAVQKTSQALRERSDEDLDAIKSSNGSEKDNESLASNDAEDEAYDQDFLDSTQKANLALLLSHEEGKYNVSHSAETKTVQQAHPYTHMYDDCESLSKTHFTCASSSSKQLAKPEKSLLPSFAKADVSVDRESIVKSTFVVPATNTHSSNSNQGNIPGMPEAHNQDTAEEVQNALTNQGTVASTPFSINQAATDAAVVNTAPYHIQTKTNNK